MRHLLNLFLPLVAETRARRRTREALLSAFYRHEQRARS